MVAALLITSVSRVSEQGKMAARPSRCRQVAQAIKQRIATASASFRSSRGATLKLLRDQQRIHIKRMDRSIHRLRRQPVATIATVPSKHRATQRRTLEAGQEDHQHPR